MENSISSEKPQAERALMADDEINLFELWEVLVRRWKTIAVMLILCVIIGGVIAVGSVKQYEYSTTVELGRKADGSLVESVATAQAKLNQHYIPLTVKTIKGVGEGFVGDVDVKVPRGSELLVITSMGAATDEEMVQELHTSIVESMVKDQNILVEKSINANREEHNLLELKMKDYQGRIARLRQNGAVLERELELERTQLKSDGAARGEDVGLLQAVVSNAAAIMHGERDVLNYQSRMLTLKARITRIVPTRTIAVATRAQKPTGIGRLATVVLASIMGLFIGVLAAIFHEFLDKARSARAV